MAAVGCDLTVSLEYSMEAAHKTEPNLIYMSCSSHPLDALRRSVGIESDKFPPWDSALSLVLGR